MAMALRNSMGANDLFGGISKVTSRWAELTRKVSDHENTHLSFRGQDLKDEGVIYLCVLLQRNGDHVTHLDLDSTGIVGEACCTALAQLVRGTKTLQSIKLTNNSINEDDGIRIMEGFVENSSGVIEVFDLSNNPLGSSAWSFFATEILGSYTVINGMLLTHCNLKELSMVRQSVINDGCWMELAAALKINRSLKRLDWSLNTVGPSVVRKIGLALRGNSTLTEVELSGNAMGNTGARALSDALRVNSSVKRLDINKNGLTADGGRALGELLASPMCTGLQELNVGFNSLNDEGAAHIFDALRLNTTLTSIDLRCTNIVSIGSKLANGLAHNNTLTSLGLAQNGINDQQVETLATTIGQNNENLACIDLSECDFTAPGLQALHQLAVSTVTITSVVTEPSVAMANPMCVVLAKAIVDQTCANGYVIRERSRPRTNNRRFRTAVHCLIQQRRTGQSMAKNSASLNHLADGGGGNAPKASTNSNSTRRQSMSSFNERMMREKAEAAKDRVKVKARQHEKACTFGKHK